MKSLLIETLGDYPMIRVIDFLLENRIFDYSKAEIARQAGVSRTTLDAFWKKLVREGMVRKSRAIGRATLYRFNPQSEISKRLIELDFAISKQHAEKLTEPRAESPSHEVAIKA
jgi:DNA-binding GntR family transcriptional regulator